MPKSTTSIIYNILFLLTLVTTLFLVCFVFKALLTYVKSKEVRAQKKETKKTLGEVIKKHRVECKMTQEFLAESLGVSRQAISKWESEKADPSTSNLVALAKLFGMSAEELLKEVQE